MQLWQGSIAVGMGPSAQMLVASDTPLSADFTLPGMTHEQIDENVACYGAADGGVEVEHDGASEVLPCASVVVAIGRGVRSPALAAPPAPTIG